MLLREARHLGLWNSSPIADPWSLLVDALYHNNVMNSIKRNSRELTERVEPKSNGSSRPNATRLRSRYGAVEARDGTKNEGVTPTLSHKLKHNKSILALAVSSDTLFAGTEGGEILVGILIMLLHVLYTNMHAGIQSQDIQENSGD